MASTAPLILALTILAVVGNRVTANSERRPWPPTTKKVPEVGQVVKLAPYKVHGDQITLSGFSSGGSFAQQLQISYSSLFRGIAVYSHTYYKCGPGNGLEKDYDEVCTTLWNFPNERLWDPNRVSRDIAEYAKQGLIEDPSNLRGKKLYVYTGTLNWLFTTDMSLRILNIYQPLIRDPSAIFTRVQAANLSLPSDTFGGPCTADSSQNFFIAKCGISGPYEALKFILGDFVRKPDPSRRPNLQPLQTFDQSEFFEGNVSPGMDNQGFLYIPQYCRDGINRCHLHFYFHGCTLGREFVSDNHIRRSGYLELAEENGIIMVFPQAQKRLPENEIGCWDTYGLTGPLFGTQKGLQVAVMRKMLTRILSPSPERPYSSSTGYYGPAQNSAPPRSGYQNRYNGYQNRLYSSLTPGGQGSRTRWTRSGMDSEVITEGQD